MKGFFANIRDDRSGPDRDFCHINAMILAVDAEPVACTIVDASHGGAKLIVDAGHKIPDLFRLVMQADQDLDEHYDCEVRWRANDSLGVKFLP